MKKIALILFLNFTFQFSASANNSIFLGTGPNFSGLATFRIGFNDWEFGQQAPAAYGFNKKFKHGDYYTAFGLNITLGDTLGVYGGVGFDYEAFWGLNLRGELFAIQGLTGYSRGAGLLGLAWYF